MEKRWAFSSSSKSETLVPSSTLPLRSTALAWKSRASAREVLPDARCPARARFRMSSVRYFDMGETPYSNAGRGDKGSSGRRHGSQGHREGLFQGESTFVQGTADDATG